MDRFWNKVNKQGPDDCWEWTGGVGSHGYGKITQGRQWEETSHRFAYTLEKGDIPKGQVVRHACDNRRCCNPAHLELGTQAQNIQDMHRRGGTKRMKVNYETATVIRERALAGERGIDLAAEYGVTPSTISVIKLGKQWKREYHLGY